MKIIHKIALCAVTTTLALSVSAQNQCDIDMSIANITKGEVVPEEVNQRLEAKLSTTLAHAGVVASDYDAQFFIAGRFDDAYNDVTSGPSSKSVIKTTLTLMIGDAVNQKVFATESFELKGVGSTDVLAYTKALNQINAKNAKLLALVQKGRDRIIEYYNANYTTLLNKARTAMANRDYDEALFYATSIPSCCNGYDEAQSLTLKIYSDNTNYISQQLLAQARAAWSASPDAEGARQAQYYLAQIDPSSSSYAAAQTLSNEITKTTQKQWNFEHVQKYKDEVALEKQRIEAAKQVAVAWAKRKPRTVNRYIFIR